MNSHFGNWSLDGLSNLQKEITVIETHWIEMFLISLKRYWNANIQNGFA
jgi:hypothetical protein